MRKIYILEDDNTLLELTKHILEKHGFSIYSFENHYELLNQMMIIRPELLILDNLIDNNQTGLEITQKIKSIPEFSTIPIIITSGQDIDLLKIIENGPDGYLKKPFDPDSLLNKINFLINKHA